MIFHEKIFVPKATTEYIEKLLNVEPKTVKECFGEDKPNIRYSAKFSNGYGMDIEVCGVQYEEGSSNTAWTQAILLNPNGQEVCISEPSDDFLGEWELEDEEGNYYSVEILKETNAMSYEEMHTALLKQKLETLIMERDDSLEICDSSI